MHIINPFEQLVHSAFNTFPGNIKEIMYFEWICITNHCYSWNSLLPGILSDWSVRY